MIEVRFKNRHLQAAQYVYTRLIKRSHLAAHATLSPLIPSLSIQNPVISPLLKCRVENFVLGKVCLVYLKKDNYLLIDVVC